MKKSSIRLAPQLEVYKKLSTQAKPAVKLDQNPLLSKQAIATAIRQQKLETQKISRLSVQPQLRMTLPLQSKAKSVQAQAQSVAKPQMLKAIPPSISTQLVRPQLVKQQMAAVKLSGLKPWIRRPQPHHVKARPKLIKLEGRLETQENISSADIELIISQPIGTEVKRRTLNLVKKEENTYSFTAKIFSNGTIDGNQRSQNHSDTLLIEILYDNELLFSNEIMFDKKKQTQKLDLVLSAQTTLLELANETPTIFGYSLKLVPRSPRPSDTYDWSNDLLS